MLQGYKIRIDCSKQHKNNAREISVLLVVVDIHQRYILQHECAVLRCTLIRALVILCRKTAMDRVKLEKMGVTHILNAAASEEDLQGEINTREEYYRDMNITYCGVAAVDVSWFDISKYFFPAAEFIHKALSTPESKS